MDCVINNLGKGKQACSFPADPRHCRLLVAGLRHRNVSLVPATLNYAGMCGRDREQHPQGQLHMCLLENIPPTNGQVALSGLSLFLTGTL